MKGAKEPTHLFTLRLWQESVGEGQREWRGRVQALPQGEAHYFRDWQMLVSQLQIMLTDHREGNANLSSGLEK